MPEKSELINLRIEEAKSGLVHSGLSCIGLLVIGGIVTGISYSLASPGGTYLATTGLFLFGGISGIVALWRLFQLLFYVAKRGKKHRPVVTPSHHVPNKTRTWGDLE